MEKRLKELKKMMLLSLLMVTLSNQIYAQEKSVARRWNEALLEAIRNDLARPTVHARNLFQISAAMYDAWAAYDDTAVPFFLGNTHGGYFIPFENVEWPSDKLTSRNEAISYACFRLIEHRFSRSPGWDVVQVEINHIMDSLGYDISELSVEYVNGSPAALGNYIAQSIIDFGMQDGSNERQNYINQGYEPANQPLNLQKPFTLEGILDPNRWQPLQFESFVDQSGNEIPGGTPQFSGAEWGNVVPFSMDDSQMQSREKNGLTFQVYNDTDAPCYLESDGNGTSKEYKWNFELVSVWSAHLDPYDGVKWDISPGAIGNITDYPVEYTSYNEFYDLFSGGELPGIADGYSVNPSTGEPYAEQIVPRGDYARVLAEFWADGPDSETPPGHWFTLLNYVNDHPKHEHRFKGAGEIVDDLEWDVKSYFLLGGTMHDVAISSWSIKGYYDYVRPITAIRYMATKGQSSDETLPNYDPHGIELIDGYIELIEAGDPLVGEADENVGKVKVLAWKGHDFIDDSDTDEAGVGWILGENWWPYQRPSFVTPPFAGYISGHSTFSSAAAEVLTLLTGDEYFPGGMGEFVAKQNEFLVFEKGPSVDITLQWAKYYDASDQCSLSRIWGGIHPPMDDIRGRILGRKIGKQAFDYALKYFENEIELSINDINGMSLSVYPNPVHNGEVLSIVAEEAIHKVSILSLDGKTIRIPMILDDVRVEIETDELEHGVYLVAINTSGKSEVVRILVN